jgi:hypothetical protein
VCLVRQFVVIEIGNDMLLLMIQISASPFFNGHTIQMQIFTASLQNSTATMTTMRRRLCCSDRHAKQNFDLGEGQFDTAIA